MDIQEILTEYDSMYGSRTMDEIDAFLTEKIKEAMEEQDYYSALTLMNEMMGFCRDTSRDEKGLLYCKAVQELFDQMGISDTVEYALSLINIANAYRAFGHLDASMKLFAKAEDIFDQKLPKDAFHYASLYNNWALLYQELGDFAQAEDKMRKALKVVDQYEQARIEQATTRCNLAVSMLHGLRDSGSICQDRYAEAVAYLKQALEIFEADGGSNFHYSGALSAMGDACYMQQAYGQAAAYYKRAMQEIEKHTGKTQAYIRVQENYELACEHMSVEPKENNLVCSRRFYEQYGRKMIHEQFGDYEDRIAVGMAGAGSDCYGFDDSISMDHDYGVGFCMWLTQTDYDDIGADINLAYEMLIQKYTQEHPVSTQNARLQDRRGAMTIGAFYENTLGIRLDESTVSGQENAGFLDDNVWLTLEEQRLAEAVNGQVFRDDLGIFTRIRDGLCAYYPDRVWRMRIVKALHDFSQYAQSNYARMMGRKDAVTAMLCVQKGIESAMDLCYLLNRTYAPYYKWKYRGLSGLEGLQKISPLLAQISRLSCQEEAWKQHRYDAGEINRKDQIVMLFEQAAGMFAAELYRQQLTIDENPFLELQSRYIMQHAGDKTQQAGGVAMREQKDALVDRIVKMEWEQFDKVKNEGGRADCQDDWETFSIMRRSQYMAWDETLLASYEQDLINAQAHGWNLIMEKYARMMKSTAPDRYQELESKLPKRSEEREQITEAIVKIQVNWMEQFAAKYPKMAGNARSIHTAEDNAWNTSYETYLRGELGTYSDDTLGLYAAFISSLYKNGENLAYNIMNNTAKLYGYQDVKDAQVHMQ